MVVAKSEPISYTSKKQEGGQLTKCVIRLKEPGGDYGDEYLCQVFGNLALVSFEVGELVVAALDFKTHEHNGSWYQDIVAKEIAKLKN